MNTQEKTQWLREHLANCLGEELPTVVDIYTFDPEALPSDCCLASEIEPVQYGRILRTYRLEQFVELVADVEVLTKETFALACLDHPKFGPWYLWNVDRGRIPL